MKKSILATVLAVALALAGVGIMPAQAKTADTGTVKVTVKTESGAPIPDADVNFTPVEVDNPTWEFEQWASGHTDKSGVFQTGELASGTYDVSVYAGQLGELNKQITVTKNKHREGHPGPQGQGDGEGQAREQGLRHRVQQVEQLQRGGRERLVQDVGQGRYLYDQRLPHRIVD
jgi:hypothetical protein